MQQLNQPYLCEASPEWPRLTYDGLRDQQKNKSYTNTRVKR
jgi:hypothetical protein